MNRVLVTGAGGLVGTALVQRLRSLGDEVITLESRSQCDLTSEGDTMAVFKFIRPNQVYHLAAAVFGVGGNLAFPGEVSYRNSMMNLNVLEAAHKTGVSKVVAMGSAAMYADGLKQPMSEVDALTGMPHASEFAYAFSKRAMLVQQRAYAEQYGLDFAFVIATNMYGPADRFDPEFGHVVPSLLMKFIEAERTGGKVEIWGDGTPTRDFLYSVDAAAGLHVIMQRGHDAFNLASGTAVPITKLVDEISTHFPSVEYFWNPERPLGQLTRSYDITRIQQIGFRADFNLSQGIYQTVCWLRDNLENVRS